MQNSTPGTVFGSVLLTNHPRAIAWISGNQANPKLSGVVKFYETPNMGVLIEAEVFGLPSTKQAGDSDFFAMHIHENGDCSIPFDQTGEHYSRIPAPHPKHSGDMIPLMGNEGYAWVAFYSKRVNIWEIVGRSVIIHSGPDDFTSQPSGNAGDKIGCGVIRSI